MKESGVEQDKGEMFTKGGGVENLEFILELLKYLKKEER